MLVRSSTELVRQQNSTLVLSVLRRHVRLSHTEIAAATGLASATISAITADLEQASIIERIEQQPIAARGRPRILFSQRRDCGYVIVITISSDVIQYSLVDYAGTLLDRFSEARESGSVEDFLASIRTAMDRVLARSRIERHRVLLVSVSSKGLVHPTLPRLVWSPIFGANSVDFGDVLGSAWHARLVLNNETLLVATALSQVRDGPVEGEGGLVALSLGHSIGLGIARVSGSGEPEIIAPNFGHMLHATDGALCRCGSSGCIEAYAGFYAILRAAFEAPMDRIPAKFVPLSEIEKIAAQARQGRRMARMAFRQAGIALGNGLSRVLSLYGLMPVHVTGPGTRYYDLLEEGLRDGLAQTQVIRLGGMPSLAPVLDEASLIFEGHLNAAFSKVDQEVLHLVARQRQAAS